MLAYSQLFINVCAKNANWIILEKTESAKLRKNCKITKLICKAPSGSSSNF